MVKVYFYGGDYMTYKYKVDTGDDDFLYFRNFAEMKKALIAYFNELEANPPRFYNTNTYAVRLYKRNSVASIKDGNPEYLTCEVSLVRFNWLTSKDMSKLHWSWCYA